MLLFDCLDLAMRRDDNGDVNRNIESRIRNVRRAMVCLGIVVVGTVIGIRFEESMGAHFPAHLLLFSLLGDAEIFFVLWRRLKRLKNKSD